MSQFLAPILNTQIENANGAPLSGGTVEIYLAGTSTAAASTSDKAGVVPNTNPIVLNTLGLNNQGAVWLTGGFAYKFIIKDSTGIVQRTIDNVSGINDSAAAADQWVVFAGTPTFVSATSFTVPGDQTQTFPFGTRLKTLNTGGVVYATVVRSVFSTSTTVTVLTDSGVLDSGLSTVSVGLVTAQNPSIPGTVALPPYRQRVINGAFRIDQRGSGAAQIVTFGGTVAYTIDRFYVSCLGANVTAQRVTGTGYKNALTITGAASNTGTLLGTRLESSNVFDWTSRQVYVQVPISAVGITTLTWNVYTADVADVFSAKTLIATGTITVSATIDTKYFSFNAGANAGRGIAIEFVSGALTAGQSITYQGAFQAEAGQVTTFESIDIGEDLRRCYRYFWAINGAVIFGMGQATSTNSITLPVIFPVTLRAAPTLGANNITALTAAATPIVATTATLGSSAASSASINLGMASASFVAGNAAIVLANLSTAALQFSAEL